MLENKICSRVRLKKICAGLRKSGKRIVFTNGCFDILHYGHVKYLQDAKSCGDVLVVALNSDKSVKRIKGPQRPIIAEKDRMRTIAGLASVDYVTLFDEDTPVTVIKTVMPHVLIKGADWKNRPISGSKIVQACGGSVRTVKFEKGRSTTGIIKKIIEAHRSKRRIQDHRR